MFGNTIGNAVAGGIAQSDNTAVQGQGGSGGGGISSASGLGVALGGSAGYAAILGMSGSSGVIPMDPGLRDPSAFLATQDAQPVQSDPPADSGGEIVVRAPRTELNAAQDGSNSDNFSEIVVTAPRSSAAERARVAQQGSSGTGRNLILSGADVMNLKKTLQTEWVRSAGKAQAYGIIDTILNRLASGHWGDSIADVVNARKQFSDINGPIAWAGRDGIGIGSHSSVDQIPDSWVRSGVSDLVDSYLQDRASRTPSSVGGGLNYANPYFSSQSNLPWIEALDGPRLGSGNAIHYHGTVPSLQRYIPAPYTIQLPTG